MLAIILSDVIVIARSIYPYRLQQQIYLSLTAKNDCNNFLNRLLFKDIY